MKKNGFYSNDSRNFDNNLFSGLNFDANKNSSQTPPSQAGLEEEINKYSSMSEERLMQEMFYLVEQGRKNGTLDNAKLEEFFNSASCMLSGEQITKLRSLIDMAKNG